MNFTDEFWRQDGDLAAGEHVVVEMVHGGYLSVGVSCEDTGTAVVEYSLNPKAETPVWLLLGNVGAGLDAGFSREAPTQAIRITAAVAGCSYTVLQAAR